LVHAERGVDRPTTFWRWRVSGPLIQLSTQGVFVFEVATKDCRLLTDTELAEMADLAVEGPSGYDVEYLSTVRSVPDSEPSKPKWVLITQAHEDGKLRGFAFSSLERIGGTPCLLIGEACFTRMGSAEAALKAVMRDLYRRAVMAFPDEDVLVGARVMDPSAYRALTGLTDIVPLPGHKASGEERAWGRRLMKRFSEFETNAKGQLDDRTFVITGDKTVIGFLDYSPRKVPSSAKAVAELFTSIDEARHDTLVCCGWAMVEDLAAGTLQK